MNPLYEEQEQNLAFIEIGMDILRSARNELYLNLRFLDVALSSLQFQPESGIRWMGTDGSILYFQPEELVGLFRSGRVRVNRAYLHSLFHCLFGHLWNRRDRDKEYWNLACDIAAEYVMDGLYLRPLHVPGTPLRREYYQKLRNMGGVVTAERVYRKLCEDCPRQLKDQGSSYLTGMDDASPTMETRTPELISLLRREFTVDDHSKWEEASDPESPMPRQQRWEEIRERMQTEMETFGKEAAGDMERLEEQVEAASRERYDYREFLRKFSVLKEEMQVDMDSFDYIFYHYGMSLYGNMPLIEPLETKEQQRIEDFVIVLDTSMSCKGELIRSFLEQTCSILGESESFFRKIHIHILQCDDKVQEDVVITDGKELKKYMKHFTVKGYGGTDFRPAFGYVEELLRKQSFSKLRGLIYFTDGYGVFPVRKPPYETAFVFLEEDYRDVDVPPWAIKLILPAEELERSGKI